MPNIELINKYIRMKLEKEGLDEVTAIEAAGWLNEAGILDDSRHRRGLPLRVLLRNNQVIGAYQTANRRWYIRRT